MIYLLVLINVNVCLKIELVLLLLLTIIRIKGVQLEQIQKVKDLGGFFD